MAKAHSTQASTDAEHDLTRDEIYETLSNPRRRYALHYLNQHEGERVALNQLAAQITVWENGGEIETTTADDRKHVYTALQQFHLPKMAELGIVAYDDNANTVALDAAGADLDVYLDVVQGSDVPWSLYYVGFSCVSAAVVAAAAMSVYPLGLLPGIAWSAFLVVALGISALAHLYDTRTNRLGVEGPPPEVEP